MKLFLDKSKLYTLDEIAFIENEYQRQIEKTSVPNQDRHSLLGRRLWLRKRVLRDGMIGLRDSEIVEIMLMQCAAIADVKPLANRLTNEIGALSEIVRENDERLLSYDGIDQHALAFLRAYSRLCTAYTANQQCGVKIDNTRVAENYIASMINAHEEQEKSDFAIVFFDKTERTYMQLFVQAADDAQYCHFRSIILEACADSKLLGCIFCLCSRFDNIPEHSRICANTADASYLVGSMGIELRDIYVYENKNVRHASEDNSRPIIESNVRGLRLSGALEWDGSLPTTDYSNGI